MAVPTQKVELQFGGSGWVDVTSDAGNISINRGTNRVMDDYQAGTLQITFTNNNRRFDPLNTSSDLWYGVGGYSMVQPSGNIRVTTNSTIVFYGWVQDWSFTYDSAGLNGNASVTAGDLMYYLSRVNFTGSTEPVGLFTGDRIANTLTTYALPSTSASGKNTKTLVGKDVHAVGDNVLSYLQQVARSSPGDLFASASSSATLVFKDKTFTNYSWLATYRHNLVKYPSSATTTSNGWRSTYSASTATPYYPGTAINSKVDSPNTFHAVDYQNISQSFFNPSGTALSYVFSCWVRGNGGTVGVDAYVDLYDAQGNAITYPLIISPLVSGTAANNTTWINLKGTVSSSGAMPTAGIGFVVSCNGTTNAYSFIADGFHVEQASTFDGVYFDGTTKFVTSSSGVRYEVAWDGDAYASSSTMGINTASSTASTASYITFADANSQGASYGNGTAIPFMTLNIANSGLNLYTQAQVVGTNATATVTDSVGTALYGLRTYSQTDNLTTSVTRPNEIASEALGYWRLPEYRVESFDVALESLTSAQQNIVLGLDLADVIRLCFQPSAQGSIVDKYYQILSITSNADVEREHISFQVASLSNVPIRVDSPLTATLNSSILA